LERSAGEVAVLSWESRDVHEAVWDAHQWWIVAEPCLAVKTACDDKTMMKRPITTVALFALAASRLSRLVVSDLVFRRWRNRLAVWMFPDRYAIGFTADHDLLAEVAAAGGIDDRRVWLASGLSCRSCVGLWAALILWFTPARRLAVPLAVAEVARRV